MAITDVQSAHESAKQRAREFNLERDAEGKDAAIRVNARLVAIGDAAMVKEISGSVRMPTIFSSDRGKSWE